MANHKNTMNSKYLTESARISDAYSKMYTTVDDGVKSDTNGVEKVSSTVQTPTKTVSKEEVTPIKKEEPSEVKDYDEEMHGGIPEEDFLNADFNDSTEDEAEKNESVDDAANYKCFVIVNYGDGWKIDSGWEFKEDAIDRTKEDEIPRTDGCQVKIIGKRTLKKFGLDEMNDGDWMKGLPGKETNGKDMITEKNFLDRSTGFYDKPRKSDEIANDFSNIDKEPIIGYDHDGDPIYLHYDAKRNVMWANVNDKIIEHEFDRKRDIDTNIQAFFDKVLEEDELDNG